MTFKAYTTAVINKLTYVSFHKVGLVQPSGEVVNFANLLKYLCAKSYENIVRFDKFIAKIIMVQFFASVFYTKRSGEIPMVSPLTEACNADEV